MDQKQRICLQRQKVREALGMLHGVSELFGAEDRVTDQHMKDLEAWTARLEAFEAWVFDESPIA